MGGLGVLFGPTSTPSKRMLKDHLQTNLFNTIYIYMNTLKEFKDTEYHNHSLKSVVQLDEQWPHSPWPPMCSPFPLTRTEHQGLL